MVNPKRWIVHSIVLALFALFSSPARAGSLDGYIAGAKKEGAVTLGISLRKMRFGKPAAVKYLEAFEKRYPFLKAELKRIGGVRERERVMSEMTAGMINHDVATISSWMVPTVVKAKLARVLDWEKLGVPNFLAHPDNMGISLRTPVYGIAYNRELIPDDVAKTLTWESCVDPKWKGQTAMEARPIYLAQLYQDDAWGREKTLEFARRWAANKPILEGSRSTAAQKLAAGAFAMFCGLARKHVREMQEYAGVQSLGMVYPEPVSIGIGDLIYVPEKAKHPNAAILYMAWSATREAQNLLDDADFTGHPSMEGNEVHRDLRGKKVVYARWDYVGRAGDIIAEILEAMGIPVVR